MRWTTGTIAGNGFVGRRTKIDGSSPAELMWRMMAAPVGSRAPKGTLFLFDVGALGGIDDQDDLGARGSVRVLDSARGAQ